MQYWHEHEDWTNWREFTQIGWGVSTDAQWKQWEEFRGTVFLCGHGTHRMGDGYTKLPRGTQITFYGYYGYTINATKHVPPILKGDAAKSWTPDRVIEEFKVCPNLTLSAEDARSQDTDIEDSASALRANPKRDKDGHPIPMRILNANQFGKDKLTLSEIFDRLPGKNFVWSCCQELIEQTKISTLRENTDYWSQLDQDLKQKMDSRYENVESHAIYQNTLPPLSDVNTIQNTDYKDDDNQNIGNKVKSTLKAALNVYAAIAELPNYHKVYGILTRPRNGMQSMRINTIEEDKRLYDELKRTDKDRLTNLLKDLVKLDRANLARAAKDPRFAKYHDLDAIKNNLLQNLLRIAPRYTVVVVGDTINALPESERETREIFEAEMRRR